MMTLLAAFKRKAAILLAALALLVSVEVERGIGAEASSITMDDIVRAWQEREARFHSGAFVVEEVRFVPRGGKQREGEASLGQGDPPRAEEAIPPNDVTQECQRALKFEGEKLRYMHNQPVWSVRHEEYVTSQRDNLWTGKIAKSLTARDSRDTFDYRGTLFIEPMIIAAILELEPLLAHYRPSLSQERELRRLSVSGRRESVDGSPCLMMEGGKRSFWLDPQRGFIIRRWMMEWQGRRPAKLDIFYVDDPAHGWVPAHWTFLGHRRDGSLWLSFEGKVVEQSINTEMRPGDFELEFPPGTLVTNNAPQNLNDSGTFVVRPDGSHRRVIRGELDRISSLKELYDSEPGQAGLSSASRGTWRYWIGGTLALVLGIVALALVRARRMGKQAIAR